MPYLVPAQEIIEAFEEAEARQKNKDGLYYVNNLQTKDVEVGEQCWFERNPVGGLSPLVSPMQNSPQVGKGTYKEYKTSPIRTRHSKVFTADELEKITSPDPNRKISAAKHIAYELIDMERRIWETMEFVAACALGRGRVTYVNTDPNSPISVDAVFNNVTNENEGTSWATADYDIPAKIDAMVSKFKKRFGKKPDKMVMTTDTWLIVKNNSKIKAMFSSYARTQGLDPKYIYPGMVTPEYVAKCGDWPEIVLRDELTQLFFTAKNAEVAGADQVVETNEGTWGISVGDTALCNWSNETVNYGFEATVTAVVPGISFTITIPATKAIAKNATIAFRPTFFPQQIVQFIADEGDTQYTRVPFGMSETTVGLAGFRGPRFDVFRVGNEPNLGIARRAWHEFGIALGAKVINLKVIV